jgi:hypothetical protein
LRGADSSSREVLPNARVCVCQCVWSGAIITLST